MAIPSKARSSSAQVMNVAVSVSGSILLTSEPSF